MVYREYSRLSGEEDTPYYPIRLLDDKALLKRYVAMAQQEPNVTFVGRLGTYRYLDMHVTIAEALHASERYLAVHENGQVMPAFCVDPLT